MGKTKDIKAYLKKVLDEKRYDHTLRVRKSALKLAKQHMTFESHKEKKKFLKKVSLAALLHDCDKNKSPKELWDLIKAEKADLDKIKDARPTWHAFSSAVTARQRFGMTDKDLLNALRFHTTGRSGMTDLEKIIYLADCIEPGRDYPGVDDIRKAAQKGIDAGCLVAMGQSIRQLKRKGVKVCPLTLEAHGDLKKHAAD